jgi:hypothetical protein
MSATAFSPGFLESPTGAVAGSGEVVVDLDFVNSIAGLAVKR